MTAAFDQDMPSPVTRNRPRYGENIHAPLYGLKARAERPTRRPAYHPLLESPEDE